MSIEELGLSPMRSDPTQTRYFRSFASYEIPFRPQDPLSFAQTEGLASFYKVYLDLAGRVVRFDKIRLVRMPEQNIGLPYQASPGQAVYFESVRDSASEKVGVGQKTDYAQTELANEFFVGVVDQGGQTCSGRLIRKEIAFSDVYEYGASGRLRRRTLTGLDRMPTITNYDSKRGTTSTPLIIEEIGVIDNPVEAPSESPSIPAAFFNESHGEENEPFGDEGR
jgi:hypothetical protein